MIEEMLSRYPLISDQVDRRELSVLLHRLEAVMAADVPGDAVELGCYEGTASLFLQRLLQTEPAPRHLHVYDSFGGLPTKTAEDDSPAGLQFKAGELQASKAAFIRNFKQAGLPLPVIHKGWFDELAPEDLPAQVAFAFLDGDFYASIKTSLKLVWPRLSPGAAVVVDDYQAEALPGARRAVDEWLSTHPARLRSEASLAIITR